MYCTYEIQQLAKTLPLGRGLGQLCYDQDSDREYEQVVEKLSGEEQEEQRSQRTKPGAERAREGFLRRYSFSAVRE
jgi:hypothetical protein